ncbi:MAG: DUF4340 domain-containing protein [Flavobacteriales bacterium]|jgi:hypothetical protein|nr:DUF4340 domain-containing protein [Flavobacteriales bacterium]MBT5771401.1 DUF4340 domain-containing protein [Flavobacteriaceae bacterium]MBT6815113.1 DUF4340 domain-containing protein [Flavobacteriales bacterium]MBT7619614.1 DUF4340 domain-containing protein [Flavobacteriales bacterium]
MKNKSLVYISIFISIIYFSSCRNEVKEEVNEKDFYLTETENIDKIIMSDKAGNIITLEKEEKWILNSKYSVMEHQIERTLEVMKDLRIKSSVSEAMTEFVLQNIATKGVKVEIFEGERKIKSYYIGGNTSNHDGTYMIMENAENAYVMHMPTKPNDLLAAKYGIELISVNQNAWRERIKINISPEDISEVKVIDFINKEQSYTINIKNKTLTDFGNNEILIDSIGYHTFASFFSNLKCGEYKPDLDPKDFIMIKKIYITNNNQTDSLIIYDKSAIQKTQKEFSGSTVSFYAQWNNSDIVIIQNYIFNKVLITLDEIKKQNYIKTSSM